MWSCHLLRKLEGLKHFHFCSDTFSPWILFLEQNYLLWHLNLTWAGESSQMDLFHLKQKSYQGFPRILQKNPTLERPQCLYQLLISIHFNKKRSKHIGSRSAMLREQPRGYRGTVKCRSSSCICFSRDNHTGRLLNKYHAKPKQNKKSRIKQK